MLQDNDLQLSDLEYIKTLGSGTFSYFFLVRKKAMPTENQICNFTYALKKVSQSNNIRQAQIAQYIESEKKIILQIEHPFIVKLVKTLKDMKTLYSFINDYLDDLKFPEFIKDSQFKSLSKKLLNKIKLKD